ncbi:MAG: NAD(P)-dependent oxidoreductase, partial [Bacteroidales bacterium]|nr:NAD(P)-dependent oxidoreductase [Bacteroidales bacterium]
MKNILITGSRGQLGNEIKKLSPQFPDYNFIYTDVDELNITNYDELDSFFKKSDIDFLINCAAYNAVDKAEEDPEIAELINATAVKYLSKISKKYNAFYIHISTDYVFDGKNNKPYIESDEPKPLSNYALSKYNGEKEALNNNDKSIVFRTSWLYSEFGNNFVKTMMKYGKEKDELKVIFDQIGTPTYAADLAKAILTIIPQTSKLT